jgi:hypothetical protein
MFDNTYRGMILSRTNQPVAGTEVYGYCREAYYECLNLFSAAKGYSIWSLEE